MSLLNPSALWLLLLAVPLVALYALRVRPPRATIATFMFWEPRHESTRRRAPWYRVQDLVSLIFQLALLALFVTALAEPRFNSRDAAARQVVIVIDNSASMHATDVRPSRFERARAEAEKVLDHLAGEDEVAIVTAGGMPRVVCRSTQSRSLLRQAVASVSVCDSPAQLDDAIALAGQLPHQGPRHLFIISDHPSHNDVSSAFDQVHAILVGGIADNVAITKFQARRSFNDAVGYEVLIEVQNFSRRPTNCRFELTLNDRLIDVVPLELAPGDRWNRVLSESSAKGGRLMARLVLEDKLALDNIAWSVLSDRKPRDVYLVSPGNLFLSGVLNALPQVELHMLDTVPERVEPDAVLVLYQQSVDSLPPGRVLVIEPVSSTPSWRCGPLVEVPYAVQQRESPLLQHVRLGDIAFLGARRLELNVASEVLLQSPDGDPLLFAIRRGEGNVVVINATLDQGDLPLRTAFPILMANALTWLTDATGEFQESFKTGDFVELARDGAMIRDARDRRVDRDRPTFDAGVSALSRNESPTIVTLRAPSGRARQREISARHSTVGPLDECGIWRVEVEPSSENMEPSIIRVACNLNDGTESDLLTGQHVHSTMSAELGAGHHPVWWFVVLGALCLTLAEWLLYHRRWIG